MLRLNPWWEGKEIEKTKGLKKRFLLAELSKYIKDPQIIAITGLRRVGKTVLIHQMIEELIKKVDAKRILYFSFDEILGKSPNIIEKVLSTYENEILRKELKDVYVFLDEINHVNYWQVIVKRFYDLSKRIKFIVSGSSNLFIRKTKESLAGRIYEFELKPLSFKEFLYLQGKEVKDTTIQSRDIKRELSNYFIRGGFPEIMEEEDFEKINKYVSSVVDKIIFYDIPKVFDVAEPMILKEILSIIARKPGALIEYQKIASTFSISYQTVSKYINCLEKAFLIKLLYNYRGSPIAMARKSKKAYMATHSIIPAFLSRENDIFNIIGEVVENIVIMHINADFFWRKYYEVDAIYDKTPLEVKYREDPKDIKGVLNTAKKLKTRRLTVVTKDFEKVEVKDGIEIVYIPLWKFLMEPFNKNSKILEN
jgi:predicted AAA+ superfamily ATPase